MNNEQNEVSDNSIQKKSNSKNNTDNSLLNRKSLKVQFNKPINKNNNLNNIKSSYKTNQINDKQNQNLLSKNKFFKIPKTKDNLINGVPSCCYVPPIKYNNNCKEIKKPINYGSRIQKLDSKTCNHYLIGNDDCEKCCKLISYNNEIFSLHCAWHHQILSCSTCENTITESDQKLYKGKNYCLNCYEKMKGLHASNMMTKH